MIPPVADTAVLSFPEYREPARRLALRLKIPSVAAEVHRFPDGECRLRLPEALPEHVVLCRSLDDPDRKLVELGLAAETARCLGARRLTLAAPYLCYMRQDRAFRPGEAVSQHIVGGWLARCFDAVITVDPHLHRTPRIEDAVPAAVAISVSAGPVFARWLRKRGGQPLLVGPDLESRQWVAAIAESAGCPFAVARKERRGDHEVRVRLPDESYGDRDVILVDDLVSTGHTLAETARLLHRRGVRSVTALVTHALFTDGAEEQLTAAGVGEIISTDSVLHASNALHLDGLLADALPES